MLQHAAPGFWEHTYVVSYNHIVHDGRVQRHVSLHYMRATHFSIATPGRARRTGSVSLRAVQASARMSAIGGLNPPPQGTALAGSCRKELLRAMLAAMANIWPQRRCKACANAGRDQGAEASALPRALLYKVFGCRDVKRPEHQFDDHEPYRFRRGKRIGEQLLTTHVFLGKAIIVG